jgi:peptidoglycan/LPS O-acetylase OafA/YrhL
LVAAIFAVAASVTCAFAIHRWIEEPLLDWSKRLVRRRPAPSQPAPAALIIQAAE